MNEIVLPVALIRTLSLTLVITSVLAVESRRLRFSASAYVAQALLIVALLFSFARQNSALYWWGATALDRLPMTGFRADTERQRPGAMVPPEPELAGAASPGGAA